MAEAWDFLRTDKMPHIWCPGCGHGVMMNALLRTMAKLDVNKDDICVVSGIDAHRACPAILTSTRFTPPTAGPRIRHRNKAGKSEA